MTSILFVDPDPIVRNLFQWESGKLVPEEVGAPTA